MTETGRRHSSVSLPGSLSSSQRSARLRVRAFAQGTSTMSGVVRDSTGSLVPGATVTATNTATGAERTAVTDAEGRYRFTGAAGGRYEVRAALAGFRTELRTVELAARHGRRLHPGRGAPGTDRGDRPATRRAAAGRPRHGRCVRRRHDRAGGHHEHARLRRHGAADHARRDAEHRLRVRQRPRAVAGPQLRTDRRRRRGRRSADDRPGLLRGAVRHRAGRGPEGPARRLVRTQRQRRRHQHHDAAADQRARRVRAGGLRERREQDVHRLASAARSSPTC